MYRRRFQCGGPISPFVGLAADAVIRQPRCRSPTNSSIGASHHHRGTSRPAQLGEHYRTRLVIRYLVQPADPLESPHCRAAGAGAHWPAGMVSVRWGSQHLPAARRLRIRHAIPVPTLRDLAATGLAGSIRAGACPAPTPGTRATWWGVVHRLPVDGDDASYYGHNHLTMPPTDPCLTVSLVHLSWDGGRLFQLSATIIAEELSAQFRVKDRVTP